MAGTPTIGHQRQVLIDLRDAGRGSCLPMRIDRIGLSGSASPTTGVDMVRPEEFLRRSVSPVIGKMDAAMLLPLLQSRPM